MRPRPHQLRPAALAIALAIGVVVPAAWAWAGAPTADAGGPELPSVAGAVQGLYDDQGCLHTGVDTVDCSVRADRLDQVLAEGTGGGPRHLEGFVGPLWSDGGRAGAPRVLPETVLTHGDPAGADGGGTTWTGLVRNEGDTVVAAVTVTARVLAADGGVLGTVEATSPVTDVRPGEPVPFTLSAPVPGDRVGGVEWSARGVGTGSADRRALAWTPYWERPAGGEPVAIYLFEDRDPARPHLHFGAVAVVGPTPVARPQVLVGWLDADGRLVAWGAAPVVAPDGAPVSTLAPGGLGDALVVAPMTPPPGGEPILWVVGA